MKDLYNSEILSLVKKDFIINNKNILLKKELTSDLNGLLIIYAPWCNYCVLSKDMWNNLATLFKGKFKIYSLNSYNFRDENHKLTIPLNIRTYPLIKFITKKGNIIDYNCEESDSELTKFIIKNI